MLDIKTRPDELVYHLASDVAVTTDADGIAFASPRGAFKLAGLEARTQAALARIQHSRRIDGAIEDAVLEADGVVGLALLFAAVGRLAELANVRLEIPGFATLVPISPYFRWSWRAAAPETTIKLSRFAYVRRRDAGLVLESPLSHARLELHAGDAAAALARLARGASVSEIASSSLSPDAAATFAALLLGAGFAGELTAGRLDEDADAALRQWEFHDLLFHSRSRLGRHDEQMGGTYRFLSELAPKPVVKEMHGLPYVQLSTPDLSTAALYDPSLLGVMEWRVSVRSDDRRIITLDQLGTFLFRVARLKARMPVGRLGEVSKRPYPNGGASYEIELYCNVDRCDGLTPGFYWYHPELHRLYFIRPHDADTLAMLQQAHFATGRQVHPQVMITMAARFQRVAWKYAGMAYATILKNTGVLYATMYYVATAMGLAPCGIGLGDSDLFARVAGTDYYEETSVGEFILSGSAPS